MKRSRSAAGSAASSSASTSAAALQLTRARIVATLPSLDSSALSSILTTHLADSSVLTSAHCGSAAPLHPSASPEEVRSVQEEIRYQPEPLNYSVRF